MHEHITAICLITFKTIGYFNRDELPSRGSYITRFCSLSKCNHGKSTHRDVSDNGDWCCLGGRRGMRHSCRDMSIAAFLCTFPNQSYFSLLLLQRLVLVQLSLPDLIWQDGGKPHYLQIFSICIWLSWMSRKEINSVNINTPLFPPSHFRRGVMVTNIIASIREGFCVRTNKWTQRNY